MGISASYISQNGRARLFDLEGVPVPGSMAADLLGAHVSQAQLPVMGGVPMHTPAAMPGIPSMSDTQDLSRMVAPGGCLVVNGNKLGLRGEESMGGENKIYGSVGGVGGFWNLDAIDSGSGGTVLNGNDDKPDGNSAYFNGKSGATLRLGRTVTYIKDGMFVVKEFYRLANITPNGRIKSISAEIEQVVGCIDLSRLGGGNGKYGVKLFGVDVRSDPVHPIPDAFAFGAEADLDTWNEEHSHFDCNYDESGNVLEHPPVKVVAVAACPGGTPGGS